LFVSEGGERKHRIRQEEIDLFRPCVLYKEFVADQ
jgi:hypothetical protein